MARTQRSTAALWMPLAVTLILLLVFPAAAQQPLAPSSAGAFAMRPSETLARNLPPIRIETLVNGLEADEPAQAVEVPIGETVAFLYEITNGGSTVLTSIAVSDDSGIEVTCPGSELQPGAMMTCRAHTEAAPCLQIHIGSVSALASSGKRVTAKDRAHYLGLYEAAVTIEKRVNGDDADERPGPLITPGEPVSWTFLITNSGLVDLRNIKVVDNGVPKVVCPQTSLPPGEAMTCTATSDALAGQQDNSASVTGYPPCGDPVSESDWAHYLGSVTRPGIRLAKLVNEDDANIPPGPSFPLGSPLFWTFVVSNTGDTTLTNVTVTDAGVEVTCPRDALEPEEAMTCTAPGTLAEACGHTNRAAATGQPLTGGVVSDEDEASYFGSIEALLDLETYVNSVDSDTPPGVTVTSGGTVQFTYQVTNAGNVGLTDITLAVFDTTSITPVCPKNALLPAESMTCTASGGIL